MPRARKIHTVHIAHPEPEATESASPEILDEEEAQEEIEEEPLDGLTALVEPEPLPHSDDKEEKTDTALVLYDPLQRYLAEIRRYPLLTIEEEHDLAIRYKEHGEIEAAYRLVTANLRLVVMFARRYERAVHNLLDLIQEGSIGLMEAVRNFDPYRGVRFPSYAVWWVRAYIIRYLMNNWRMVKLGTTQAQRKLFFNLQREKERLEAEGFFPAPKLIAQNLGVKEEEVVEMEQRMSSRDLSLDTPIDSEEEDGASLIDFIADKHTNAEETVAVAEYQALMREKMAAFAQTLKGKEEVIFRTRLLAEEPVTLQEIGDQYGISRERIRQLESRLKKKLKDFLLREIKDAKGLNIGFVEGR
ncbi:MAG: sigma-70 family RNA polymerase sigma factor [Deltaproteobacteria bacterium]|nr:sigma-70 family RNA polymerase sigma factor [Deltaproteobacteria bacterium]